MAKIIKKGLIIQKLLPNKKYLLYENNDKNEIEIWLFFMPMGNNEETNIDISIKYINNKISEIETYKTTDFFTVAYYLPEIQKIQVTVDKECTSNGYCTLIK